MHIVTLTAERTRHWIDALLAISADVSPWTAESFLRDLPDKWTKSFAALHAAKPVAYAILSRRHGHTHINQLMVAPARRASGIGASMLREAVRRGATSLKVAPGNTRAIRFYMQHGWRQTAIENDYLLLTLDTEATAVGGPVLGNGAIAQNRSVDARNGEP